MDCLGYLYLLELRLKNISASVLPFTGGMCISATNPAPPPRDRDHHLNIGENGGFSILT